MTDWRPGASLETLRLRADLLRRTRNFFAERDVLEVETPLLAPATVTDLHLHSLALANAGQTWYLQTSPEFAMKRLLSAGSGSCYQICKAFRADEVSRLHNPEFTLLEWYRTGFSLDELMDEVAALATILVGAADVPRLSYREIFLEHLGFDPHAIGGEELALLTRRHVDFGSAELDDTDHLQLLLNHCIEPSLPHFCFVYDFPAPQAALAVVQPDASGTSVAKRFELYGAGMELANGYQELTDAGELRRRFERDLKERERRDLPSVPVDERLLAALAAGLPACAGVALGFDRLVMLAAGLDSIGEVLAFDAGRV